MKSSFVESSNRLQDFYLKSPLPATHRQNEIASSRPALIMTKILFLAFVLGSTLSAETKIEAENRKLREQLAAAQAALSAVERTHAATQQDLTKAVVVQTNESKATGKKLEAVVDQISESEETGKKLVETVQAESAATRTATKKIADAVSTTGNATVAVLSSQMKEQERSTKADARKLANDLKESNIARDKATADRIAVEEASAIRQAKMQKDIDDLKVTADIIADRKDSRVQGYAFWTMVVMVVLVPLVTIGQIHLTNKVKGVHSIVNGRYSALEEKYNALEEREHARELLKALHTPPPNGT